ncbi:DUF6443 domain-containing protein [Niabella hibiscisoli]|nr:DUF6443 domain-containing protein [Niabella hibiscisoli]
MQASPDRKDIIIPITYDALGRQDKQYLPYAASGSGDYKGTALSDQSAFYLAAPSPITSTGNPFSQTAFEASPLNRPLEQAFPGQSWALGGGHTITIAYDINVAGR